jgi:hypothetical protein
MCYNISIILNERRIDTQGSMIWTVLTLMQFLPKHHMISMEERFAWASALCTAYMYFNMWINHTQRTADQYSRIDDMNTSDDLAFLAHTPYKFNGGEKWKVIGTLHNIHVLQYVDRYSTNHGRSILKDPWNGKCRRLINSGSNAIWFLWRRELIQRWHSAQHTCTTICGLILNERRFDTQGPMKWQVPTFD